MKILLAVGIGSFMGGVARYLLSLFIQTRSGAAFPFGTLGVNILGCFLIGLVVAVLSRGTLAPEWRPFLVTGILGGFTTFSAFSMESVYLLQAEQYGQAILYILASVVLGLLATFAGMWLVKLA
ncbi:fluoride efflux transporter CrcB [Pontibacter chinhatensis]|uniref:Fluoride-specific ion channel FluC n=1 Tax=Pontibacter chinhatensis TaxID=1436961 RepID=A0A1I2YXZ3_9BACT|nr:fluoride efflux transporter CrcB [Pontibacter chinhatensis]SFH30285.1 camphor resistance protein CrcB [Pontibacter chinhatensis]